MAVIVGESSRGHAVVAACAVLPILTFFFILLRLWSRTVLVRSVGWDDYTAVAVLIFCVAYSILIGLSTTRKEVPDDDPGYVKWINDADMIYLVSVLGYKLSILILYLRLFSVNKIFRYLTWATMFFVTGYLLANLLTQIFGCSPRPKYWLPETPGHCINYTKAGLAYGSMNIISDLIIFILPLPIVWQLKLSRKEKAGVSIIFLSGAITCIVAVVRYIYIVRQNAANAEYFIWSIMEINIGVMCSCMPALRPLFGRILPKLSIHSIRSKLSRTRYHHGSSEQAEEGGAIIEMEPHRGGGLEANENENGSASTGRSPTVESGADAGVRNIVAF